MLSFQFNLNFVSAGRPGERTFIVKLLWAVFLLLLLGFISAGCSPAEEPEAEEEEPEIREEIPAEEELLEEPGQAVRSGRLTLYSDDGSTRWLVASEQAVSHQEGEDVTFEPVAADVFLQEEEPDYIIEGEFGRYHIESGKLEFPGTSEIRSDDYRFTSIDIIWRQADNIIFSQGETEVDGDNFTARARGFSAPASLESFTLYGEEDEPARISWKEDNFAE